nr:hypothetical protein [Tanacetum cinerariifolium]
MLTEVGDFISELRHHGRWKVFSKKYFGHLLKCIIRIPWQTIKPSGGMMCQGVRKEIQTKDVISDLIHFATLGDMQEFVKMLVRAINNFDESKVIGVGGSGKVYAGELSHFQSEEKSLVAIKRLDRGEMILIYEHASGESLGRFLSSAAVTWTQRLRICLDAAKGLSFLHDPNGTQKRVLHCDIRSANILLDENMTAKRLRICLDAAKGLSFLHDPNGTQKRVLHCDIRSANILLDENMTAKVSDFGLSKMGPPNQQYSLLITGALGTPGYCDPVLWRRTP